MKKLILILCLIPSIALAGDSFNQSTDIYRIVAEAYDKNKLAAENKYKGMRINIQGEVFSIKKNFSGYPTVTLKAGALRYLACEFPKNTPYLNRLLNISTGDTFKCQGTIRGKALSSIFVKDCVLK